MVTTPKPKYVNGSKYPNAKMTVSNDLNPYAGPTVNKNYAPSTAAMEYFPKLILLNWNCPISSASIF